MVTPWGRITPGFHTPDFDPIASFNLPQRISQLSTSFTTQVEIVNRNVSELNLALYNLGLPLNLVIDPYNLHDYRPTPRRCKPGHLKLDDQMASRPFPWPMAARCPPASICSVWTHRKLTARRRYWQNQRNLLILGDTNLVVKEMFGEIHVWVTDIACGQPVSGLSLVLYNVRGVEIGTAVSDNNGFANFTRDTRPDYLARCHRRQQPARRSRLRHWQQ